MNSDAKKPRGWYSRGYLPHFDGGSIYQTATFRLADSLPAHVIEEWKTELDSLPEDKRDPELRRRIEDYTDNGYGECLLRIPEVAETVESALLHFHGVRYLVQAWVLMPNHVHVLFKPEEGHVLADIMHSWKSYTAHRANEILNRTGSIWHPDYFDRFIRDEEHFQRAWMYIENNPVKAGLCARPEDWLYGGARRRVLG